MTLPVYSDVVIIGAGPSGSVAGALLHKQGQKVLVLEKAVFPRFSIGESLLPQSMQFIEEAGLLEAVHQAGFQFKNGAAFAFGEQTGCFNFEEKFSPGWGTTYQVERARFDKVLADTAAEQGVDIRYQHDVIAVRPGAEPELTVVGPDGQQQVIRAGFILDASGFGRVLPRLLDLDLPSDFPVRQSVFSHIADNITDPAFDRDKILITVHPQHRDVWFWLIPLSADKCSFGVVARKEFFDGFNTTDLGAILQQLKETTPPLQQLLSRSEFLFSPRHLAGYACNVKSLHGDGFALLGNAGEFLDPVFSSGVTIAMKSAALAADVLVRKQRGEKVDWQTEYAQPLKQGVDTFRCFVEAWYDGRLQDIIFAPNQTPSIKEMISSILAGYAWDLDNPYVAESKRRINVLAQICRPG